MSAALPARTADRRAILAALAFITLAVLAVAAAYATFQIRSGGWTSPWREVAITTFQHESGFSYVASLGRTDLSGHAVPSPAQLVENGLRLLPGNAQHADIRALGGGRHSFWYDIVYFSSSDNTDPLTNGRRYIVRFPPIGALTARGIYLGSLAMLSLALWGLMRSPLALAGVALARRGMRPAVLGLGVGLVGGVVVTVFVDPVPGLTILNTVIATGLSAALFVLTGCALARGVRTPPTQVGQILVAILFFTLGVFVCVRPGLLSFTMFGDRTSLLAGLVAIGVVGTLGAPAAVDGVFGRLYSALTTRQLACCVAAVLLVALPRLILPVVLAWDQSGFMDSHGYDSFAVNIANGRAPEGNSQYMPVYQYGMALVYYLAGHFFFVQQVVNVFLACAGIAALCLATWMLFRSGGAVLITGLLAALSTPFFYAVHFTQIESWYVPATSMILLAWACYWTRPGWAQLGLLGLALSVAMNMRNQGAMFFAFMCLAPLFVTSLRTSKRLAHVMVIGAIVAASLAPWTIRNYLVDGRFTPAASRSTLYVGLLNDRRIGLYGIRYWEGWTTIVAEFQARYPDVADRDNALMRLMWTNLTSDPGWLTRAVMWRTGSFYGLLPSGYFSTTSAIVPTDWPTEWQGYAIWRMGPLLLLPLSLIGACRGPLRTTLFLIGAILANLSINLISAMPEDRISYPVLLIHMLLAGAVAFRCDPLPIVVSPFAAASALRRRWLVPALTASIAFFVVCRTQIGTTYTFRPLIETAVTVRPTLELDASLPLLDSDWYKRALNGDAPAPGLSAGDPVHQRTSEERGMSVPSADLHPPVKQGDRVRLRGMVTNYMYPPKRAGRVPWVPSFATEPDGPIFYYVRRLDERGAVVASVLHGVTYAGAELREPLREGDTVEIEGELLYIDRGPSGVWLRANKVKRLPPDVASPPLIY